jgi:hypothetical protein
MLKLIVTTFNVMKNFTFYRYFSTTFMHENCAAAVCVLCQVHASLKAYFFTFSPVG